MRFVTEGMNSHHQQQSLNEQQLIVATPACKRNTTTRWITRYFPVRFAHFFRFKCQFDIFWPVAVSMAPRNLQQNGNSISRMTSQEDLASPDGKLNIFKITLSRKCTHIVLIYFFLASTGSLQWFSYLIFMILTPQL